jgi:hypothetical protein
MPAHVHAPPPPCPPASSQPPEQSRHACASQPPLPNLSGALPNDPPPCAVRCPCLVSSRAERTTMAFFVVHASTEGRRVLLSGRKTSRTRATPIRRPIAASRDRGHTRRSLSFDGYGANTPRGRSSCAPLPHRQDSPQPAKMLRKMLRMRPTDRTPPPPCEMLRMLLPASYE